MGWYSIYGTGATLHGVNRTKEGRLEFTSWLSVFWIPLIPVATWSALYAGELPADGLTVDSHCFADLKRIPHQWKRNFRTLGLGLLAAAAAVAPAAVMITRTNGRAATQLEMVLVFAAVGWAAGLIFWTQWLRRKKLQVVP